MLILLSPAKSLNFEPSDIGEHTEARLLDDSDRLVKELKKKSVRSLKKLMSVSDAIAELNVQRFQEYERPFAIGNAKQAVLAFDGDVYTGMQADTFTREDLDFAQEHLRILSGLYGLLRPMDLIRAYRLEMGTRLRTGRRKNLYEFWGDKITELINTDLAKTEGNVILNLASQEYFKSVNQKKLAGRLVDVHFKENRNGDLKVISFNAKKARGAMAGLAIKHRIIDPEELKELTPEGYHFSPEHSSADELMFIK
ncbi:peroxide stress protein YaaA [Flavilitoribacter nigricans]|uniref:UPF0246 protein CRP01_38360 n=1 Tax=Flavilitoribacter nigricans (strain ATCC 23147 / DSM 23189 / NBRC 102662 / NCIMB 1420 / SS-2) TaxID=1122177 RepID=A0A2D0MZ93_FLAN2|nr:peroxide stress protein YaaA [Flavilitoribacter nigricans]PHN01209.1 hypothetical protein CRP01_38360 [Flavilitoribacter nigricans DSM 23189 = NBRC 102662]